MNIIDTVTDRIEEYRKTNKNPCKNYKTKAAAEKATSEAAERIGKYFSKNGNGEPARYVVFFIEAWGRWVGAIDLSEVLKRDNFTGGYLGIEGGFYKY